MLGLLLIALAATGVATYLVLASRAAPQQAGGRPPAARPAAESTRSSGPRCSRSTAQRELERRGLLDDGFPGISRLICRDFTGDGAEDAAFTRESTGSSGTLGWGVLMAKPGGWDLALFKEDAQVGIKVDGEDLLRSVPVADAADPAYEEGEGAIIEAYRFENGRFQLVNDQRQFGAAFPDGFYEDSPSEDESSSVEQCGDSDPAPIENVTAENVDCATAMELAEGGSDEAEKLGWTCTSEDTGYESSSTVCAKDDARVTYDFAV